MAAASALVFSTTSIRSLAPLGTQVSALAWVSAALETVGRVIIEQLVASHHAIFHEEEEQQPKSTRDDRLSLVESQRAMREGLQDLTSKCPGLRALVDTFLDRRSAELLHIDATAIGEVGSARGITTERGDEESGSASSHLEAVKLQWSRRKTEALTDVDVARLLLAAQPAFAFNTDALVFVQALLMHILKHLVCHVENGSEDDAPAARLTIASAQATLTAVIAPSDLVKRCIAAGTVAAALFDSTYSPPERLAVRINFMRGTQVWRCVPVRVRPSDPLREPIATAFSSLYEQISSFVLLYKGEPLPPQATAASLCMFLPGAADVFAVPTSWYVRHRREEARRGILVGGGDKEHADEVRAGKAKATSRVASLLQAQEAEASLLRASAASALSGQLQQQQDDLAATAVGGAGYPRASPGAYHRVPAGSGATRLPMLANDKAPPAALVVPSSAGGSCPLLRLISTPAISVRSRVPARAGGPVKQVSVELPAEAVERRLGSLQVRSLDDFGVRYSAHPPKRVELPPPRPSAEDSIAEAREEAKLAVQAARDMRRAAMGLRTSGDAPVLSLGVSGDAAAAAASPGGSISSPAKLLHRRRKSVVAVDAAAVPPARSALTQAGTDGGEGGRNGATPLKGVAKPTAAAAKGVRSASVPAVRTVAGRSSAAAAAAAEGGSVSGKPGGISSVAEKPAPSSQKKPTPARRRSVVTEVDDVASATSAAAAPSKDSKPPQVSPARVVRRPRQPPPSSPVAATSSGGDHAAAVKALLMQANDAVPRLQAALEALAQLRKDNAGEAGSTFLTSPRDADGGDMGGEGGLASPPPPPASHVPGLKRALRAAESAAHEAFELVCRAEKSSAIKSPPIVALAAASSSSASPAAAKLLPMKVRIPRRSPPPLAAAALVPSGSGAMSSLSVASEHLPADETAPQQSKNNHGSEVDSVATGAAPAKKKALAAVTVALTKPSTHKLAPSAAGPAGAKRGAAKPAVIPRRASNAAEIVSEDVLPSDRESGSSVPEVVATGGSPLPPSPAPFAEDGSPRAARPAAKKPLASSASSSSDKTPAAPSAAAAAAIRLVPQSVVSAGSKKSVVIAKDRLMPRHVRGTSQPAKSLGKSESKEDAQKSSDEAAMVDELDVDGAVSVQAPESTTLLDASPVAIHVQAAPAIEANEPSSSRANVSGSRSARHHDASSRSLSVRSVLAASSSRLAAVETARRSSALVAEPSASSRQRIAQAESSSAVDTPPHESLRHSVSQSDTAGGEVVPAHTSAQEDVEAAFDEPATAPHVAAIASPSGSEYSDDDFH